MEHIIDYLNKYEKRLISPLWKGKKAFNSLCLGHLKISEALGFETYQATPVLRLVKENKIVTEDDLNNWISKHKFDYSIFDEEIKELINMKKNANGLCGGGCFGPLTIVSGIVGAERMLKLLIKKPQFIKKFVECVTTYLVELAEREEKEGAQFFWIAEPLAALLSPEKFWEFSGVYLEEIYASVEMPGFLHVCGKTLHHTKYMEKTGAEVLSIDSVTDIGKCLRMVDENTVIMGNISPALLKEYSAQEVVAEVKQVNEECKNYKNFVMSTGCSVVDGTPEENMYEFFEVTKQYPIWSNEEYKIIQKLIKLLDIVPADKFEEYIQNKKVNINLINVAKKEYALINNVRLNLRHRKN
jgi:MtaA/CmuA family methyltransferase